VIGFTSLDSLSHIPVKTYKIIQKNYSSRWENNPYNLTLTFFENV